eukprot:5775584-Prymnesium_polylepis.1
MFQTSRQATLCAMGWVRRVAHRKWFAFAKPKLHMINSKRKHRLHPVVVCAGKDLEHAQCIVEISRMYIRPLAC